MVLAGLALRAGGALFKRGVAAVRGRKGGARGMFGPKRSRRRSGLSSSVNRLIKAKINAKILGHKLAAINKLR